MGVDFVGVTIEDPHVAGGKSIDSTVAVGYPYLAYVLRYGVTAGLDAAVKLSATGTFALDGKVALLRGDVVSLALDPGLTAPFRFEYLYLNLPVLLSLEVGNDFTVTLYPKTSYVLVTTGEYTDTAIEGLLVGGGLHVQMRIVPGFAVTPSVEVQTLVWGEDRTSTVIDFGLGFSFGSLPEEARE